MHGTTNIKCIGLVKVSNEVTVRMMHLFMDMNDSFIAED